MASKLSTQLLVLVAVLMASMSPEVLATKDGTVTLGKKHTHIRVYVHEKFSGQNATVGTVAPSQPSQNGTMGPVAPPQLGPMPNATFGRVDVVDDALRVGQDAASELVGRYQGMLIGSDLDGNSSYISVMTLVFNAGKHNGSTLSLQGRYDSLVGGEVIERAVVGGTGGLRMARGYSLLKMVSTTKEAAVFELNLFVFTPRIRF
ncbi:hypothetical protein ACP70R_004747 [Stipagrostis hirtigluma subsp. patula]